MIIHLLFFLSIHILKFCISFVEALHPIFNMTPQIMCNALT